MSEVSAVAFYARVSSEAQARDHTIGSQIAALEERIAADGFQLAPDHSYVDDGYSGTSLLRPALEKLRDAVASGRVERIYVHAPDRLARHYAYQVLLIEEFHRAGAAVVFLNRPIGGTAEDDLLLQVQGMIAEYERAKLLERVRRGRRHAARSGSVSALTAAPFGYRYICRDQGGGVARFEVVEDEARIVRLIFAWVGLDRLSLREVCRRLQRMGLRTRRGLTHWNATTIRAMLDNPAYVGRAVLGRSRCLPAQPRLRPIRRNSRPSPSATQRVPGPREEWIEIAVAALVEPAVFEAARAQLVENRKRKRERPQGPRWLLQGLTVCRCCGYAYYAKTSALSPTDLSKGKRHYYRCVGADAYRLNGATKCGNPTVRGDRLEQVVWDQVRALLEDPSCVADEYRRRISWVREEAAPPEEIVRLDRQMTNLRRGIDRLIDSYAGGWIDNTEFEPRIAGLKLRMSQLHKQRQAAVEAANAERELSLVISRLEDFSAKVSQGLDRLNWLGMREIIHTVVRRIEIDHDNVEVVFRVPPPDGRPPQGGPQMPSAGSAQHCTDGYARLRGPWSESGMRDRPTLQIARYALSAAAHIGPQQRQVLLADLVAPGRHRRPLAIEHGVAEALDIILGEFAQVAGDGAGADHVAAVTIGAQLDVDLAALLDLRVGIGNGRQRREAHDKGRENQTPRVPGDGSPIGLILRRVRKRPSRRMGRPHASRRALQALFSVRPTEALHCGAGLTPSSGAVRQPGSAESTAFRPSRRPCARPGRR
jgi:site-specific DNA recombinase